MSCESGVTGLKACILLVLVCSAYAQVDRAVELAEHGRCKEALPVLRSAPASSDKQKQQRIGVAGVRCAMTVNLPSDAALFLDRMLRSSPHDPAVLYLATHVYSDLSTRASQELMMTNPGSTEVHQLKAEALETGGDWQHALEEYRAVAARDPIHPMALMQAIGRLLPPEAVVIDETISSGVGVRRASSNRCWSPVCSRTQCPA